MLCIHAISYCLFMQEGLKEWSHQLPSCFHKCEKCDISVSGSSYKELLKHQQSDANIFVRQYHWHVNANRILTSLGNPALVLLRNAPSTICCHSQNVLCHIFPFLHKVLIALHYFKLHYFTATTAMCFVWFSLCATLLGPVNRKELFGK